MTTIGILVFVAIVIGLFSYFTNAGFGDRRPREPEGEAKKKPEGEAPKKPDQASGDDAAPPPSK
jgi:hypothetical protein